jgi:hypothetical protein
MAQFKKLKNKAIIGASKNIILFDLLGIIVSFINNFKPSAKGCKIPKIPTTFGPLRLCILAIILRSSNVKKATEIKIGIIKIKLFIIKKKFG